MNVTLCPMNALSSIVTPSQMNVWLEILQLLPNLGVFLDLDERTNFRVVPNFAAVKVNELGQLDSSS
jgi:hypothetical protein